MKSDAIALHLNSISKKFPGVKALDNVDFNLKYQEIHAIIGANGAGKSTLVKILSGQYRDYSGIITIEGRQKRILSPKVAVRSGISIISQEIDLVDSLSISENIFLGQELLSYKFWGILDKKHMNEISSSLLRKFGGIDNPDILVSSLSTLEKRIVEIVKAIHRNSKILLFDEPTAELTPKEIKALFQIILELKSNGRSILYISHHLEEVFEISDQVTVLRDGRVVFFSPTDNTTHDEVITHMFGERLSNRTASEKMGHQTPLLDIRNLSSEVLSDIVLEINKGETIGIINIPGNGASNLLGTLFGKDTASSGEIYLDDELLQLNKPRKAIDNGIGYLSGDRHLEGLLGNLSARINIVIPYLKGMSFLGVVHRRPLLELTSQMIEKLGIRTNSYDPNVLELSGGNQQKVLLARWLWVLSI